MFSLNRKVAFWIALGLALFAVAQVTRISPDFGGALFIVIGVALVVTALPKSKRPAYIKGIPKNKNKYGLIWSILGLALAILYIVTRNSLLVGGLTMIAGGITFIYDAIKYPLNPKS